MNVQKQDLLNFAKSTDDELYEDGYGWMVDAVETNETLENWIDSSKSWAGKTAMIKGVIAGFTFVAWNEIQMSKGKTRAALSVVDFGNVRVVLRDVNVDVFV